MDNRKFVELAKRYTVDDTVKIIMKSLRSPMEPKPAAQSNLDPIITEAINRRFDERVIAEQRRAVWFSELSESGQQILREIVEESVEFSAASFFTLIDGVGGDYEGVFEIVAVNSRGHKTILNPQNTDMLHDLFSDVCEADRRGD